MNISAGDGIKIDGHLFRSRKGSPARYRADLLCTRHGMSQTKVMISHFHEQWAIEFWPDSVSKDWAVCCHESCQESLSPGAEVAIPY